MKILILAAAILLIAMFLGMYPRYKKMRIDREYSAVEDYRNRYMKRQIEMQRRREMAARNTNYITKYNSSEDYREVNRQMDKNDESINSQADYQK